MTWRWRKRARRVQRSDIPSCPSDSLCHIGTCQSCHCSGASLAGLALHCLNNFVSVLQFGTPSHAHLSDPVAGSADLGGCLPFSSAAVLPCSECVRCCGSTRAPLAPTPYVTGRAALRFATLALAAAREATCASAACAAACASAAAAASARWRSTARRVFSAKTRRMVRGSNGSSDSTALPSRAGEGSSCAPDDGSGC